MLGTVFGVFSMVFDLHIEKNTLGVDVMEL